MFRRAHCLHILRGNKYIRRRRHLNRPPSERGPSTNDRQLRARDEEYRHKFKHARPVDWNNTAARILDSPEVLRPRDAMPFHALQGRGDNEPLSANPNHEYDRIQTLLHGKDVWKYTEPPMPYTPLMQQKMRQGDWWPRAPDHLDAKKALTAIEHPDNQSPSSRKFCQQILYWIRRDFKSLPGIHGDRMDYAQVVFSHVFGDKRSKHIYIVWSTVHPGARAEIEPLLHQLSWWVRRKIKQRLRVTPNIPTVAWVYDDRESYPTRLPRQVLREVRNAMSEAFDKQLDQRVQEIKDLDTVQGRLKGVPWYMPYLWAKDSRVMRRKQLESDKEEMDTRARRKAQDEAMAARPKFIE